MHFKQIGILIGGGGLLIFAAVMNQPDTKNVHEEVQGTQIASALAPSDHRANLVVPTPQGFRSDEGTAGVAFVQDGDLRSPMTVRIDLYAEPGLTDATDQRQLKDGLAQYKIEEMEGGSGGALWQLSAVRQTPKGALVMHASQQAEFGQPDFSEAWAIFENAEVKE